VPWNALAYVLAQLCKRYGIKVDRKTVLSHAEVQPTLKITQKGKWDIARLPFDTSIQGAIPIGEVSSPASGDGGATGIWVSCR
jgi:hypothetical protein